VYRPEVSCVTRRQGSRVLIHWWEPKRRDRNERGYRGASGGGGHGKEAESPPPPNPDNQTARGGSVKRLRSAFGLLITLLSLVLLLPYALSPVYRFSDPVSTLMLWRWIRGAPVERAWTPLDRISPALPRAVIAAEDDRFCSHHGVDFHELSMAVEAELHGGRRPRGGSGITQQLAKNLFLWPGRSYVRKALELPLALWIDLVIPKRRQMEVYLNVVEWGPGGQFGAEAAAHRDFGKSASSLSPLQAAIMAGSLPNPLRRDPKKPSLHLRQLATVIAARASSEGTNERCIRSARTVPAAIAKAVEVVTASIDTRTPWSGGRSATAMPPGRPSWARCKSRLQTGLLGSED
jgi:monofunctional glycosyltransferase